MKAGTQGKNRAYNDRIGLLGLIHAFQYGCRNIHDTAERLDVSEIFLLEAIEAYKKNYGICAVIDKHIIYFEPVIGVIERR